MMVGFIIGFIAGIIAISALVAWGLSYAMKDVGGLRFK